MPALASLLLTGAAVLGFVLWSTAGIDRQSVAHETELVEGALKRTIESVPHAQESVSIWDDAIQHSKIAVDKEWLDNNLGVWMNSYFGTDQVFILNDADQPIYSMRDGTSPASSDLFRSESSLIAPLVERLQKAIAAGALRAYADGTEKVYPRAVDLVQLQGQPTVISVVPITSDTGEIQQPSGSEYLHVAIWHLDQRAAAEIARDYGLEQAAFSVGAAGDQALGSAPILNSAGRIAGFFQWQPSRPGTTLLRQNLPVLGGAFMVAAILIALLARGLWNSGLALQASRADAEHQARHDALTGLPNRASFELALAQALTQRLSRDRRSSVLMLDLDRFKQVNDTLGHRAGDDLILAVSQRLRQFVAPTDQLSRLGGDEFAILVSHASDMSEPLELSRRIIEAMAKPFDVFGSEAFVGVSIGIASADGNEADSRELIRKADIALYEAKTTGRNRAVVFVESMNELLQNRHTIEAELREALRRSDQLSVEFQPLFGRRHTHIIGAEALARWRHPRLGQVSPAHFIPVAEQTGLIAAIGELVLRRACEIGADWPGYVMAVNISPAQLRDPQFPQTVFDMLSETGMRAKDLELEITEGILLEDATNAAEVLRMLRASGIRIALDDFGTGYSSLNYLKRYPVDRIKIDRSFVSQLMPGSVSNAIVEAMVTLAHALRIEVTAEGVETYEQVEILTRLGCNAFQGFLLSPPVTPAVLITMLEDATISLPEVQTQVA